MVPPGRKVNGRMTSSLPLVTMSLSLVILGAGVLECSGLDRGTVGELLANEYAMVRQGEVWRLASFWLAHIDGTHLTIDVLYLLVVGTLAERTFGRRNVLFVFFAGVVVGGAASFLFDGRYTALVGSCDGTHALLAFYCTWCVIAWGSPRYRLLCALVVCYLFYLAICGLRYGVMGWPFRDIPSSGYDHLASMLLGTLLGATYGMKKQREASHSMGGGQNG